MCEVSADETDSSTGPSVRLLKWSLCCSVCGIHHREDYIYSAEVTNVCLLLTEEDQVLPVRLQEPQWSVGPHRPGCPVNFWTREMVAVQERWDSRDRIVGQLRFWQGSFWYVESFLMLFLLYSGVTPVNLQLDLNSLFQLDSLVLSFKVWQQSSVCSSDMWLHSSALCVCRVLVPAPWSSRGPWITARHGSRFCT